MNAAAQTSSQFADDRKPSTAPDRLGCRPIVRDPALYDVAYKHYLHSQFWWSIAEFCMSCHVSDQLGYNQTDLPAALSFEPQIIRRKQNTYRQAA